MAVPTAALAAAGVAGRFCSVAAAACAPEKAPLPQAASSGGGGLQVKSGQGSDMSSVDTLLCDNSSLGNPHPASNIFDLLPSKCRTAAAASVV